MDEDYISAESVYDRTQGKKQSEINDAINNLPKWQATVLDPSASTISNIMTSAEDMIIRVFIPDLNFDITQAVAPIMFRNMSGTHVFIMSGYYWDSGATLCVRLNVSSTSISINRCAVNGTDRTAKIQLYFK